MWEERMKADGVGGGDIVPVRFGQDEDAGVRTGDSETRGVAVADARRRYKFRSFWDCVTQTKKMEGIGGFWRGESSRVCGGVVWT